MVDLILFFFLTIILLALFFFFFSSRRRHTRLTCDWSSDVCSSDLYGGRREGSRKAERPAARPVQAQYLQPGDAEVVRLQRQLRARSRRLPEVVLDRDRHAGW